MINDVMPGAVLGLAEEVQAAIGCPALENLLRFNIPDLTIDLFSLFYCVELMVAVLDYEHESIRA